MESDLLDAPTAIAEDMHAGELISVREALFPDAMIVGIPTRRNRSIGSKKL